MTVGLVLAAILCGPAMVSGALVGSGGAETPGHAWVQQWTAEGWPAWPVGTAGALGTDPWPVIDPLPTWLAAGLAQLVGPTSAWNALWVCWIVLAAVGGGAWARAMGGEGGVGAVAVPLMPIWLGSLTSGLTEDGAVGLLALALAALVSGRVRLGGLLLGLLAWCGLYLAWLGAAVAVVVGGWRLWRGAGARWTLARSWAVGGLLAGLLAVPAAAPFRARLAGEGHHAGTPPVQEEPRWRVNPVRRADVAAFVVPGHAASGPGREHPTYAGWVTIGLAAAGGWNPAWVGVAALAAVAVDEPVFVAGKPRVSTNPVARAFAALPLADRFNHRARLWILGDLLLVGLAARGAARLRDRWRLAGWFGARARLAFLTAALAAEVAFLSPARVPLPGMSPSTPAIYAAISDLPEGPVAVAGAVGPGVNPQRVLFDQRTHGRRLLVDPNRPGPVAACRRCVLVALGDARAGVEAVRGPPDRTAVDGAAWWIP